jgi:flagellar biogenesis protein FliO
MKTLKKSFLCIVLVLVFVALASDAAGQGEMGSSPEALLNAEEGGLHQRGAQILGFFLLLGVAAYGTTHWHKRRGKGQGTSIQVVAMKPLGQREKVAILEVLGERMVVGITAHRISLLTHGPGTFSKAMQQEEKTA